MSEDKVQQLHYDLLIELIEGVQESWELEGVGRCGQQYTCCHFCNGKCVDHHTEFVHEDDCLIYRASALYDTLLTADHFEVKDFA